MSGKDDILHMLVECKIASFSWTSLSNVVGEDIGIHEIILGKNTDVTTNTVISVVAFALYKYWLTSLKDDKKRSLVDYLLFLKREIAFRMSVYNHLCKHDIYNVLLSFYQTIIPHCNINEIVTQGK